MCCLGYQYNNTLYFLEIFQVTLGYFCILCAMTLNLKFFGGVRKALGSWCVDVDDLAVLKEFSLGSEFTFVIFHQRQNVANPLKSVSGKQIIPSMAI